MKVLEIREIEIDKITVPDWARRTVMSEAELDDLKNSIEVHGQIEPVVVRPRSDGRYELVSGSRRLEVLKRLGRTEVEAKVIECTDEEAIALSIEENLKRSEEHPFDVARKVAHMHEVLGMKVEEIARELRKSKSWVSKHLSIHAMPKEVKEVLGQRVKDLERLYLLSTINDPLKQSMASRLVAEYGLDKKEVEELVEKARSMDLKEFGSFCDAFGSELRRRSEESLKSSGEFRRRNSEETTKSEQAPDREKPSEERQAPEFWRCDVCREKRARDEIELIRICRFGHDPLHDLLAIYHQQGSKDMDVVLELVNDVIGTVLLYPKDQWKEIAWSLKELVKELRGLSAEMVKELVREVKKRRAATED